MSPRLRRCLLVGIWLVFWWQVARPLPVDAVSNFTYDTKVSYSISDDNTTAVTETYAITNNTARQYLTELKLSTPVSEISGLKVSYDDGTPITATTSTKATALKDLQYDYQEIDIAFPRQNYGLSKVWKFQVKYQAKGLAEGRGGSHTVYVPSIEAGDAGDQYQVTVDVPTSFGTAHFPGAKSASGGVSGDRQSYTFDKTSLIAHSLALAFGDTTIYDVNFKYPLENTSALPKTLTIALPPDLNNQHTYVNKLDPAPSSTRLDADGNVLADYHLAPHQKITVQTDVESDVKYLEYDLSASKKKADIPADLVRDYTRGSRYWQTNGAVAEQAHKLVKDDAPVIDNVKAIYQFVIDKLSYNKDKIKFNIRQGASAALANPSNAVCLEYADLTIAMLRSQGIPARMPIGYAYSGNLKATDSVADSLHAWVEVYVPGIGWMTLDPTWGEKFDNFGKSDLDHMAFAVWGANDQEPGAVMQGSTDTGYQYEDTTLDYHSGIEAAVGTANVAVTRYIVLPFIALDHIVATSKPQVASDGNSLTIGSASLNLGSLAPSQLVQFFHPVFGLGFARPDPVKLYGDQTKDPTLIASTQIRLNWLPMLIIFGLLAAGLVIWFMVRLRAQKRVVPANLPGTTPEV